jgi:hypothetical protein
MIHFQTIFDLVDKLIPAVASSIAILGACAFFVVLILEGYLRIKEITQRRATNPATAPRQASCSCSCHFSTRPNATNPTNHEEKQQ